MYNQSILSQSVLEPQFYEPALAHKFLINTSKVIKGTKLKTRDFVKMQLLRFRKCSPIKFDSMYQPIASNEIEVSKGNQYKKFRPFDGNDHEDMHKTVENDRVKMSRETKGRIKLFNNSKINSMFQPKEEGEGHFPGYTKPNTSYQLRQLKKNYAGSKTITHESIMAGQQGKKDKRKHTMFKSENLGTKMNDYLNLYLSDEKPEEQKKSQPREKEELVSSRVNRERENYTIDVFRKKPNVAFLRKMKKQIRSRVESNEYDLSWQNRSEQLAKPNTALPVSKREQLMAKSKQN